MTYYKFRDACATKETGAYYPQITEMIKGYDYNAHDSVHNFRKNDFLKKGNIPNFDTIKMNGLSKITDLISQCVISGNGFIVSKKLKEILEKYVLPKHWFFPIKILRRKELLEDFFWFEIFLEENQLQLVDYPNSTFYKVRNYSLIDKIEQMSIKSFEDYKTKDEIISDESKMLYSISSEQIVLKSPPKMDIFKIGVFDSNFYISNSLMKEIIESKITGCRIEEATWLFVQSYKESV